MISALLAHTVALELSDHRNTQKRLVFLERLCCEGNEIAVMLVRRTGLAREAMANLQLLKALGALPVIVKKARKSDTI
jgi:hypothetical protein